MADAAVEFLLENLQQLLLYHAHLIGDAKSQVEKLELDLRLFKAFLRDSTKKRRKDDSLRELVRQIRDVVYEAEDVIDAFVTQAAETKSKSKNYFLRAFKTPVTLLSLAEQVDSICRKISETRRIDLDTLTAKDRRPEEAQVSLVRQDNVVGFEDEAAKLIGYLTENTEQLDVIPVTGMAGLGKTTLARKIFDDPAVQYEFPIRIWAHVSQQFTRKDIFLSILRQLSWVNEDMHGKSELELAQVITSHLERGRFLIVMDDVSTAYDWDELQIALPKTNKMGKVIITSRHDDVAHYSYSSRLCHKLRFLNQDESWKLLQLKVFRRLGECPPELENIGNLIAKQCNGLPLALTVIGGILVKESVWGDIIATRSAWRKVYASVSTYVSGIYCEDLPNHLRVCFLYLGMFPEDYEIPVWKLIRMWIAEGFVQRKDGISLEETAELYLEDLINRNLVKTDKIKTNGKVKTCRIHPVLHDFCKAEAGIERENLFQEMMKSSDGIFYPPISEVQKFRRICIHSNVLSFISSKPYGHRVRSFVCFSHENINLPLENISAIPAAFKLLRVLDVKPIKFTKIPNDMYQLVHLRYLILSFDLAILPAPFSKLWNIQTLIVYTTSRTLEIKADIWKMNQLRHFETNAVGTLPKTSKHSKEGENLQTLGTISPQSCTKEVFDRACNLKKLRIRGRLALLLDGTIGSFDSLGNLENLKLLNDVHPSPPSAGQLRGLPPPYKFPPHLRSLTLSATYLEWAHMSVLGLLQNLKKLKLNDNAFMGDSWESVDGGFWCLEVLHIGQTNLKLWAASANHFPRLRHLVLRNCAELIQVPFQLGDIPSLQLLDLFHSGYAAASAQKIRKAKVEAGETAFKLSIYPPADE